MRASQSSDFRERKRVAQVQERLKAQGLPKVEPIGEVPAPVHKEYAPKPSAKPTEPGPPVNGPYGGAWGAALLDRLIFGAAFQARQVPQGTISDLVYQSPESQKRGGGGGKMDDVDSCVYQCLRPVSCALRLI